MKRLCTRYIDLLYHHGVDPVVPIQDVAGTVKSFLTGQITPDTRFDDPTDLRSTFPRFTPEALAANFAVVDFLREMRLGNGASPAQIALA